MQRSYTLEQIDVYSNVYYLSNSKMFNMLLRIIRTLLSQNRMKHLIWDIRKDKQLLKWITTSVPLLNNYDISLTTYVNWILTNRTSLPICKMCGNRIHNVSIRVFQTYTQYCCVKCMENDPEYRKYLGDCIEQKYGPGIRYSWQIPGVKEKSLDTLHKNYGYDHPFKHPSIRNKAEKTFMQNYGAKNNMQSKKGMAEYKKSMNDKYGVDYTWQLDSVKQKSRQTTFDHFGVYVSSQAECVKEKQANTNYNTYGTKSALQNPDVHAKTVNTWLDNYGVDHPSKCQEIRKKQIYNYYGYDGEKFNSSWEVAFWIYCKDHKIQIEHEPISLDYVDSKGVSHKYFPDFRIHGNQLIEIKGDDQFDKATGKMVDKLDESKNYIAEAKHQCMIKNNVTILKQKDCKKYIDYVEQKYGKGYLAQFKKKPKSVQ